jgi:hypothetical protein
MAFFGIDGEGSPKVIHFFAFEHFTSSFCKRAEESLFPLKTAFFFSDGVETQENNRNIGMEKETSHYPSDLKLKKDQVTLFLCIHRLQLLIQNSSEPSDNLF